MVTLAREKILRKPVFNDIKNGKQNLIILHAFKNASLREKNFLKEIFGKKHLNSKEEQFLFKEWCEGWAVPNLSTPEEFHKELEEMGFKKLNL